MWYDAGMNQPAADPMLEGLPLFSWTEEQFLRTKAGGKLKRWGSVDEACGILWGCDRKDVYDLIHTKLIAGRKLRPHRRNSHWKVDLLSVWRYRERQEQAVQVGASRGK